MGHLGVVVGESDGGKRTSGKNSDPHETVAQVGPEKGGHDDRDDDQQSTHGGRARFFLMGLGTFFADELSDLEITQAPDHQWTHDQSREEGGQAGKRSAKSDVTENAEGRDIVLQLEEQEPIEQSASDHSNEL